MNLMQFLDDDGQRAVAQVEGNEARQVANAASVYDIALAALNAGKTLADIIATTTLGKAMSRDDLLAEGRVLTPIDHPDPAHLYVTGTGLTHLGSASTRDAMHKANQQAAEAPLTDSMKMFRMGLEGGKPAAGQSGVQPEWFYKGNGFVVAAPGAPIPSPAFAKDAGEEPEIAGIYVIDQTGTPFRARLCARQRIFRPRDRAGELPLPRALQAALAAPSGRNSGWATCRTTFAAPRASCAAARRSGRSRSCPARTTCPTPSPTSSTTTSSTRCSASRATCTSICSARRR